MVGLKTLVTAKYVFAGSELTYVLLNAKLIWSHFYEKYAVLKCQNIFTWEKLKYPLKSIPESKYWPFDYYLSELHYH